MRLVTDARALRYSGLFSRDTIDVVPSETVRGRTPWSLARTGVMLAAGTVVALNLMRRLKPAAVIGFGGYPTLPPLLAARLFGVPDAHSRGQCGARPRQPLPVARMSARSRPRCRACSIAIRRSRQDHDGRHADAAGDPCGGRRQHSCRPEPTVPLRLLVVGGSQGARVMADIVPGAIERLEPALWSRLMLTQQVREEDMARVRAVYDRLKINAELAPFFTDLPARLASNHLVVSRSGAGTVAELAAIGRPSILVPLPGSIDQDQFANAGVLAQANGALADHAGGFHVRTGWRRKFPPSPPSRRGCRDGGGGPQRRPAGRRRAAGRSGDESRRNLGRETGIASSERHGRACPGHPRLA